MRTILGLLAILLLAGCSYAQEQVPPEGGEVSAWDGEGPLPRGMFVNPIGEGADPWVVRDPNADRYLWCMSDGNRGIAIHTSDTLTSMGEKHVVWRAPRRGPYSRQIWAPELHYLDGHWYIYLAASDGENRNHLTYVLRSRTQDPLSEYDVHGPLATGKGEDGRSPNIWAIDMTVLKRDGKLYAIWSGWDEPDSDRQFLYIAPMSSPTQLSGPRVLLCSNDDYPWEFTDGPGAGRGLNEGPQVLERDGRVFVVYSCGASWLPTYKLGMLELTGDDPLDPAGWKKFDRPVFESTETTYGVGHSCFVQAIDGGGWWHIFHAKRDRDPGWRRALFVQPMGFDASGLPEFGQPVEPGKPIPLPEGESPAEADLPIKRSLKSGSAPDGWGYYGHHQFVGFAQEGLHLGTVPQDPINAYRSGEKLVLLRELPADVQAEVTIDFRGNAGARDAGLLFRVTAPSVGFDAERGYFAGLIPQTGILVVGKMDGQGWTELARAEVEIDAEQPQRLGVSCEGDRIRVMHQGTLITEVRDDTYLRGMVGLRVVDTHAVFSDFVLEAR